MKYTWCLKLRHINLSDNIQIELCIQIITQLHEKCTVQLWLLQKQNMLYLSRSFQFPVVVVMSLIGS